jgi:hypothetical protein
MQTGISNEQTKKFNKSIFLTSIQTHKNVTLQTLSFVFYRHNEKYEFYRSINI